MRQWDLTVQDTDQILRLPGGGFIRKADARAFREMLERHRQELRRAMEETQTGDAFIYDMFYSELHDHEFCYTGEIEETLRALGMTYQDLLRDPRLYRGFRRAVAAIRTP